MDDLPFDLANPPDEPPAGVSRPMMWRLAVRLHRDHVPLPDTAASPLCRACGDGWPCRGRRIAERGLLACLSPRARRAPRRQR